MNASTLLAALVVLAASLSFASAPAQATHSTCQDAPRTLPGTYTGTVSPTESQFYRVSATGFMIDILAPNGGSNVDLYVWTENCAVAFCTQANPAQAIEICPTAPTGVSATQIVEVRWAGGNGGYRLTLAGSPAANPWHFTDPGNSHRCIVYNDENNDRRPAEDETLLFAPCSSNLRYDSAACAVYDDRSNNGAREDVETLLDAPCGIIGTHSNGNGTCTAYFDIDSSGTRGPTEPALFTYTCPSIVHYRDEARGETILYDDKNGNGSPDTGETILVVKDYP